MSGIRKRPSMPKIKQSDYESVQKRLASQLKVNTDIQSELLKALGVYKVVIEQLASTSDKVAQVSGKLALNTVTSYNLSQELRAMRGESEPDTETDLKQKNLQAALAQVVKFHTMMGTQQANIANIIAIDFERPISLNLDKYKEVVNSWEKETDKEIRKMQSAIRAKENEATRAGKDDMTKLSIALQELTVKMAELDTLRHRKLEEAVIVDHHQYLLVAHHLQKVLRSEVSSYRAIYYDGTATPKKTLQPVMPSIEHRDSLITPLRQISDASVVPEAPVHDSAFLLDDHSGKISAVGSPSSASNNKEQQPKIPANPHRKTMAIPKNVDANLVNQIIQNNFPEQKSDNSTTLKQVPKTADSFEDEMENFRLQTDFISSYNSPSALSMDIEHDGISLSDKQAIVQYEYSGEEKDDLNVLVDDVLRVIAVEGEWLYGWLLLPDADGSGKMVPAEIDNVPQIGWVPLNYVKLQ